MTVSLKHATRGCFVAIAALSILALPGSASAAGAGLATSGPPSEKITVEVASINGSGCKPGTAHVYGSPDNTWFKVRYTDYKAETGGSSDATDFRKFCQLGLQIHIPQGFTFAIAGVVHRGKANLKKDADGLLRTSYYFQGESETGHVDEHFNGPMYSSWSVAYFTPVAELVYAPCGEDRNLQVKTELRVHGGSANGYNSLSMTGSTGGAETLYHFDWKRC